LFNKESKEVKTLFFKFFFDIIALLIEIARLVLMKKIVELKTKTPDFVLYLMIENEPKLINFYDKHVPYTGEFSHGNWIPLEVEDQIIELVDKFEKATVMKKISSFSVWSRGDIAKKNVKELLEKHNKTFDDIKILKINYPEPVEEEVLIDWSLI
jgi:hypothetical protein